MRFFWLIPVFSLLTACPEATPRRQHPVVIDPELDCDRFAEVLCLFQKSGDDRQKIFELILDQHEQLSNFDMSQQKDLLRCLQMTTAGSNPGENERNLCL
jgi:hypothetical protein